VNNRPQFAYTGPSPAQGYVGYVNIQETDKGVKFTVRSEGENPVSAVYEVSTEKAIELLQSAVTGLAATAAPITPGSPEWWFGRRVANGDDRKPWYELTDEDRAALAPR